MLTHIRPDHIPAGSLCLLVVLSCRLEPRHMTSNVVVAGPDPRWPRIQILALYKCSVFALQMVSTNHSMRTTMSVVAKPAGSSIVCAGALKRSGSFLSFPSDSDEPGESQSALRGKGQSGQSRQSRKRRKVAAADPLRSPPSPIMSAQPTPHHLSLATVAVFSRWLSQRNATQRNVAPLPVAMANSQRSDLY